MGFLKSVGNAVGGVAGSTGGLVGGMFGGIPGAAIGYLFGNMIKGGGNDNPYSGLPGFQPLTTDPAVDKMRGRLKELNGQQATPLKNEDLPTAPSEVSGPLKEFDPIRSRITQRTRAQEQQGVEALKRRFASMGALNTGAAVKQEQILKQQLGQQADQALGDVNVAESQERQRRNELAQQQFFSREQAAIGRNLNRELANADAQFKQKVFSFDAESKIGQVDLAYKNLQLEEQAQKFNTMLSALQAGDKQGILGSLFGGKGPLGLF